MHSEHYFVKRHVDSGMYDKNVEFSDQRDFERRVEDQRLSKLEIHETPKDERRSIHRRMTDLQE